MSVWIAAKNCIRVLICCTNQLCDCCEWVAPFFTPLPRLFTPFHHCSIRHHLFFMPKSWITSCEGINIWTESASQHDSLNVETQPWTHQHCFLHAREQGLHLNFALTVTLLTQLSPEGDRIVHFSTTPKTCSWLLTQSRSCAIMQKASPGRQHMLWWFWRMQQWQFNIFVLIWNKWHNQRLLSGQFNLAHAAHVCWRSWEKRKETCEQCKVSWSVDQLLNLFACTHFSFALSCFSATS